jgi:exodeoxyribonuclease VII large subunit
VFNINREYTVTEVNKYIKKILSSDFILSNILVKGEISNFKNHSSGHLYFSLKDEQSLIKCVMFKGSTLSLKFKPEDGMKVIVAGYISSYERDGQYQLYCDNMILDGVGDLYAEYEKLKEKLQKEGLFDENRKRQLPLLPRSVAVVTSKTGAVIRDIINVSTRRYPDAYIKLYPASVQGPEAYKEIVQAIEEINKQDLADVIIVGRGGGSLEDLWNFNREEVAYAIYNSKIPVVSAVGHETDFTIADFVADLRAPTPSAAAELVFPEKEELENKIKYTEKILKKSLIDKLEKNKKLLENLRNSYCFKRPQELLNKEKMRIDNVTKELTDVVTSIVDKKKRNFEKSICSLDALSPLKTLARGYLVAMKEDKVIRSVNDVNQGDNVTLRLEDGQVNAQIL